MTEMHQFNSAFPIEFNAVNPAQHELCWSLNHICLAKCCSYIREWQTWIILGLRDILLYMYQECVVSEF